MKSAARDLAVKAWFLAGQNQQPRHVIEYDPGTPSRRFATLELARPKKKNAINHQMYRDIMKSFKAASEHSSTGAIILTGQGDYYSAGNDLSNFAKIGAPKKLAAQGRDICFDFVDSFVSCKKPIIAAVNGPAVGIPVTTLGVCDVRLCTENSTFATPFKQLAQAPEGCSSHTFPKLMGADMARAMLDDGKKITAAEAKACGFIDEILPAKDLLPRAKDIAQTLAKETLDQKLKRPMFRAEPEDYIYLLRATNRRECAVLEKAWVSPKCFAALDEFLTSRKNLTAARVIRFGNATRFLWDK